MFFCQGLCHWEDGKAGVLVPGCKEPFCHLAHRSIATDGDKSIVAGSFSWAMMVACPGASVRAASNRSSGRVRLFREDLNPLSPPSAAWMGVHDQQ